MGNERVATKEQMRDLLRRVYNDHGPRQIGGSVVPPEEFAAMTDDEVNCWDFDDRNFMREIAQAIAR